MAIPRALAAAAFTFTCLAAASPEPRPMITAHWETHTANSQAQRALDRGLLMLYAFDIGEARVAFVDAERLDPELALAYWGEAQTDSFDINAPTTPDGEKRGADATARARRHLKGATEEERVLVDAIAKRWIADPKAGMRAYAAALSSYTASHRDDPNVLTVAAYAIYNADQWQTDGKANAKGDEMVRDLDEAIAHDPDEVGARHLRIHVDEELSRSRAAVADAEYFDARDVPLGASHLQHMAGHVWTRLGEYQKLIDDNERAAANDRAWFAAGDGPGQKYMRNYEMHVLDFVTYGLTTLGRDEDAKKAASSIPMLRERVALRTARGAGKVAAAAALVTASAATPPHRKSHKDWYQVYADAVRASTPRAAVALIRPFWHESGRAQGDPKSDWEAPPGEAYGAALLRAGEAAEAEHVFRIESERYPNDPRLEFGLAEALKAQRKNDAALRAASAAHWQGTHPLTLDALA